MSPQITDAERQTYTVARAIATMTVHKFAPLPGGYTRAWGEDRRGHYPIWNRGQTTAGLYLLLNTGVPVGLLTPWGAWRFTGGHGGLQSHMNQLGAEVLRQLRVQEADPRVLIGHGVTGPAYAVLRFEDVDLPKPSLRAPRQYLDSDTARGAWHQMTRAYYRSR